MFSEFLKFDEPLGKWNNYKMWETRNILAILYELKVQ